MVARLSGALYTGTAKKEARRYV